MFFDAEEYFTQSTKPQVMSKYFSFFRKGVLIDTEPLYLLIVGKYDLDNNTNFLGHLNFGISDFEALRRFLNSLTSCPFFITPHIFTKFIHLLWNNIKDKDHFLKIIDTFMLHFSFIDEKYINKDEIMRFAQFKNKHYDLSNTSLILTAEKHHHNSIITCDPKLAGICQKRGNLLVVNYQEIKVFIQSLPQPH